MRTVTLHRVEFGPDYILGRLVVPVSNLQRRQFWTMEQPWRDNALGRSCVPTGLYDCRMEESPRFGRRYHLNDGDVAPRSHILFHVGNRSRDTQGCILPGMRAGRLKGQRAVLSSGPALKELEEILKGDPFRLRILIGYPAAGTGAH